MDTYHTLGGCALQELYTGGPAEDEEDAHKQQQART